MSTHVFTEDQNTMEWYIDGIPVAELKRRYEAYDALVYALQKSTQRLGFANRHIDCESEIAANRTILAAAEVRP